MGWGNPQPLAQLKRDARARAQLAEQLEQVTAERDAAVARAEQLRRALATTAGLPLDDPTRCAWCLSPYVECPVHAPAVNG